MDIAMPILIKMIMLDDDEVLTCKTVWSDQILAESSCTCKFGLNLHLILLELRAEAIARGIK